ncbi:MAG: arsenate reductase ArsC [Deltaproteobacteria bacterium]|nr:arsenate reductase ArsC [Deltaproteobacteria bacterium]
MDRNILFLCTGNSARSQMGEALLREHGGGYFRAFSAGTEPKAEIFLPVVEVMSEIGIDISTQKPKSVKKYLGKVHFEKVIIVCGDAEKKCPVIFGPEQRIFWPFDDPVKAAGSREDVLSVCRMVRNQIDKRICEWLREQDIFVKPFS